jgi:hypothetical protein
MDIDDAVWVSSLDDDQFALWEKIRDVTRDEMTRDDLWRRDPESFARRLAWRIKQLRPSTGENRDGTGEQAGS